MHDFTYYAQILISGLTIGSLYALIAIGYTMVYGILRLINFAHGDMFMVAGFIMIYITSWSSGFLGAGQHCCWFDIDADPDGGAGRDDRKSGLQAAAFRPPHVGHDLRHRCELPAAEPFHLCHRRPGAGLSQYPLAAYRDPDRRHHRAAAGYPHPRADHPVGHRAGYRDQAHQDGHGHACRGQGL